MTKEILDKISLRDSYFRYFCKYKGNTRILGLYKTTKLEVSTIIIQAKKNYYSKDIWDNKFKKLMEFL